ncbi:conserved hypothetical protein [Stutzerimonas stutzeri A1501]|uniref:Uncharacterized protein n=1 Tax=Stutzerimonas stutzeri (strain A1501) TaxID=379731 RepID=A4VLN3_STUS1|nr:conserved hypothetical protein [Stutzerimonas stutzeri A1501]
MAEVQREGNLAYGFQRARERAEDGFAGTGREHERNGQHQRRRRPAERRERLQRDGQHAGRQHRQAHHQHLAHRRHRLDVPFDQPKRFQGRQFPQQQAEEQPVGAEQPLGRKRIGKTEPQHDADHRRPECPAQQEQQREKQVGLYFQGDRPEVAEIRLVQRVEHIGEEERRARGHAQQGVQRIAGCAAWRLEHGEQQYHRGPEPGRQQHAANAFLVEPVHRRRVELPVLAQEGCSHQEAGYQEEQVDSDTRQEALQHPIPPDSLGTYQHDRAVGQQHQHDCQATKKLNVAILAVPRSGITHKPSVVRQPPRLPAIAWVIQDRFHRLAASFDIRPASRCAFALSKTGRCRGRSISPAAIRTRPGSVMIAPLVLRHRSPPCRFSN